METKDKYKEEGIGRVLRRKKGFVRIKMAFYIKSLKGQN